MARSTTNDSGGMDYPPEELEGILRRVDEYFHPLLATQAQEKNASGGTNRIDQLSNIKDIRSRIEENMKYAAPYYVVQGRGLAGLIKGLLNIPLKLFARKQSYYNREVLEMLADLNTNIQELARQVHNQQKSDS